MKLIAFTIVLFPLVSSATLAPSMSRGESTVTINGRTPEICVIPTHLPQGNYSKKDLKSEQELCGMTEDVNVAICPKTASTNPGIEFYSVPAGYTIASAEIKNCSVIDPRTKKNIYEKVAKYKNSTSCSYTPSILAYYHVSRLLDGAGHVPPAVLRTLDLSRHIEIAQIGIQRTSQMGANGTVIGATWRSLLSFLSAGAGSRKRDDLLTDAFNQSYGALLENPTGELKYSALYTPNRPTETRAESFRDRNVLFQTVVDQTPVVNRVGRQFNVANVQAIVQMKDIADFIVMDTVLSQEDRFGNLHFKKRYAYINPNDVGSDGNPKVQFETKLKPEIAQFQPVLVNQMIMKDNDCGVSRDNRALKAGLAARLGHIDPKTYGGLMKLARSIDTPDVVNSFRKGMMFTAGDYATMRTNLLALTTMLHAHCQAGSLKLDLDLDTHFSGRALAPPTCEM